MKTKLLSLKQHRARFLTDEAAAADLGIERRNFMTYWRWLNEKVYSPEGSAWRRILEVKGVDLPRVRK